MKTIRIEHTTRYSFSQPVSLGPHRLYLRPREGHDIRIAESFLQVTPPGQTKWLRDVYGNSVADLLFPADPAESLTIQSAVRIDNYETAPLDFLVKPNAVNFPFFFDPVDHIDMLPYQIPCFPSDTDALRDWCAQFWLPGQMIETYVLLDSMNKAIVSRFSYRMREEPGVQRPQETLQSESGSCRDFATLFIEACRFLGLPARFVSGYLHNPESPDQHGSTHAWSEVFLPGAGWKGFDNTSAQLVGPSHIAAAVHRHPERIPPISGAFTSPTPATSQMSVHIDVAEL